MPFQALAEPAGLFGKEDAHKQIERLFLALMLPVASAEAASGVLAVSRAEHGLAGQAIRADRLHITLIHVGDYFGSPPPRVIAEVKRAADSLSAASFDVILDRAGSFAGAPGKYPHVLLGDEGLEALKAFRHALWEALIGAGVKPFSKKDFNPHVTLVYADARLPERAIAPIAWRAEGFALVHSEVGRSIYHTLGHWPLGH